MKAVIKTKEELMNTPTIKSHLRFFEEDGFISRAQLYDAHHGKTFTVEQKREFDSYIPEINSMFPINNKAIAYFVEDE